MFLEHKADPVPASESTQVQNRTISEWDRVAVIAT